MKVKLPREELRIIYDAITMFIYVSSMDPKPELHQKEKEILANLDRRVNDLLKRRVQGPIEVEFCADELILLITIIQDDIKQCGTDDSESSKVEYRVNFTVERKDIEAVLKRLVSASV